MVLTVSPLYNSVKKMSMKCGFDAGKTRSVQKFTSLFAGYQKMSAGYDWML